MAGILVVLVIAVVLMPVTSGGTQSPRISCISSAKHVATSMEIYLRDFDDVYPPVQSMPSFRAVLVPYVKDGSVFADPKGVATILFNFSLAGVNRTTLKSPESTVLLTNDWSNYKSSLKGGFAVAYADMNTRWVQSDDPEYLRQKDLQYPRTTQTFFPIDYLADQDPWREKK